MIKHLARAGLVALMTLTGLAAGMSFCLAPANAADQFRVVGVTGEDVLNVRDGPSAKHRVVGTIPQNARGIEGLGECVKGWCHIRYGAIEGWSNARFLAPDEGDDAVVEAPPPSPPASNPPEAIRSVLPDGTLELRLPDGTILRQTAGGRDVTVAPDGTETSPTYLNVQTSNLPPLPSDLANWGSGIGDSLLKILGNILTKNEMKQYLQTEVGLSYYDLVQWRLRSIAFLTRPAS